MELGQRVMPRSGDFKARVSSYEQARPQGAGSGAGGGGGSAGEGGGSSSVGGFGALLQAAAGRADFWDRPEGAWPAGDRAQGECERTEARRDANSAYRLGSAALRRGDPQRARDWFTVAVGEQHPGAAFRMAAVEIRLQDITQTESADSPQGGSTAVEDSVFAWLEKAASWGHGDANAILSVHSAAGTGQFSGAVGDDSCGAAENLAQLGDVEDSDFYTEILAWLTRRSGGTEGSGSGPQDGENSPTGAEFSPRNFGLWAISPDQEDSPERGEANEFFSLLPDSEEMDDFFLRSIRRQSSLSREKVFSYMEQRVSPLNWADLLRKKLLEAALQELTEPYGPQSWEAEWPGAGPAPGGRWHRAARTAAAVRDSWLLVGQPWGSEDEFLQRLLSEAAPTVVFAASSTGVGGPSASTWHGRGERATRMLFSPVECEIPEGLHIFDPTARGGSGASRDYSRAGSGGIIAPSLTLSIGGAQGEPGGLWDLSPKAFTQIANIASRHFPSINGRDPLRCHLCDPVHRSGERHPMFLWHAQGLRESSRVDHRHADGSGTGAAWTMRGAAPGRRGRQSGSAHPRRHWSSPGVSLLTTVWLSALGMPGDGS